MFHCQCLPPPLWMAVAIFLLITSSSIAQTGADGDTRPPDEVAFLQSLEYLERGDIDSAHTVLTLSFDSSARNPDPSRRIRPLSQRKIKLGGGTTFTSEYKLLHDIAQAEYLAELSSLSPSVRSFFNDTVLPTYRKVLERIPPLEELLQTPTQGLFQFTRNDRDGIMQFYNRALHVPEVNEYVILDQEENGRQNQQEQQQQQQQQRQIPILSATLDPVAIQEQWDTTGIVIVDNILSQEAFQLIREKVTMESTVWYQTKLPKRFGGYTGAYMDDGLHPRILLKLAVELRQRLPQLLADHPLKYMWAYKYDSDYGGINLHADEAAVNVNMWLTPDDACLDKESGGLVIYTVKPPEDWDLDMYNRDTDFVYEELIAPSGYANVTVPYKENRAVIFDSALFHTTDKFIFKKGYTNRRINLTLLYGEMQKRQKEGGAASGNQEL